MAVITEISPQKKDKSLVQKDKERLIKKVMNERKM